MQHPTHFGIPTGFVLIFFTPQRECVCMCPPLSLLALHFFQPSLKLWMQQFRAAGSALAKPRLQHQDHLCYYWRNLILLEAWTPHKQPIRQVPLLQSTSAHTCLAGDSCHFCNEVHQLQPYAVCIQASTQDPGILGAGPPCLQSTVSVLRNEPAWL